jgi:hypothetical protein
VVTELYAGCVPVLFFNKIKWLCLILGFARDPAVVDFDSAVEIWATWRMALKPVPGN